MKDEPVRNSGFLSQELLAYIEEVDKPEDPPTVSAEDREKIKKMIKVATSSLEGFTQPDFLRIIELLRHSKDDWEWFADDFYTREVVANVPSMVSRFVSLSPVLVGVVPSEEPSTYLREASRCFIYGFFLAAIALARAALEAGLNRRLGIVVPLAKDKTLYEKIECAARSSPQLLSPETASLAHNVRTAANEVLHDEPTMQQDQAFGVLVQTRGVLKELYEK